MVWFVPHAVMVSKERHAASAAQPVEMIQYYINRITLDIQNLRDIEPQVHKIMKKII